MSLWIDIKYANLVGPRLDLFKVKRNSPYRANMRCPICGDSKISEWKARGWLFEHKGTVFYKCFNCDFSSSLSKFIEKIDPILLQEYRVEDFKDKKNFSTVETELKENVFSSSIPTFKKSKLDEVFDSVYGTIAEKYLKKRKIPVNRWKDLYYCNDTKKLQKLTNQKLNIKHSERRLVIPFYDEKSNLIGVTCRTLENSSLRYLTIRIEEDFPLIYNINNVNKNQDIHVVEGPIDSMFLNNSVAAAGADLKKVAEILPKEKLIFIFDNQPRNVELLKIMKKTIDAGCKMVIWPDYIKEKDINDMILSGIEIHSIINQNTFSDLPLQLKFTDWKKTTI